ALREAVGRAERLAVLGRLAAGVAHEIRNPLGAISGCVELVREGASLGPEDRELLATVVREGARLNDLVTGMPACPRPRPPQRVPTDLCALAREVARLADGPGARVALAVEAPEILATVDPAQTRQVLWNLVRNACQVSPAGGTVEINVRAAAAAIE